MNNDTIIKVTNRSSGMLCYDLPELRISRTFQYRETKEITFQELNALYNILGGDVIVKDYLAVKSEEAVKALDFEVEPEYFYTEEDIIKVMETGSLDEFLDMLDFAPDGVIDMVKDLAVSRELNDMNKRTAISNKTGFNVTKAIEVKNMAFDGGEADTGKEEKKARRVVTAASKPENKTVTVRRVTTSE